MILDDISISLHHVAATSQGLKKGLPNLYRKPLLQYLKMFSGTCLTVSIDPVHTYFRNHNMLFTNHKLSPTYFKSRYVVGKHLPTLRFYDSSRNVENFKLSSPHRSKTKPIFATKQFSLSKKMELFRPCKEWERTKSCLLYSKWVNASSVSIPNNTVLYTGKTWRSYNTCNYLSLCPM